jgi:hypothetical protein
MILRRYGTSVQSVELNFDARALTEIGFRRDRVTSMEAAAFEADWERLEEREFAARTEGMVQQEVEQALLDEMEAGITGWIGELGEGEALLVESEGTDYPKTRHASKTIVEAGENRLHFSAWVEPPLRLSRVRKAK